MPKRKSTPTAPNTRKSRKRKRVDIPAPVVANPAMRGRIPASRVISRR